MKKLSLCMLNLSTAVDPLSQRGRKFQKEIIPQPPAMISILERPKIRPGFFMQHKNKEFCF